MDTWMMRMSSSWHSLKGPWMFYSQPNLIKKETVWELAHRSFPGPDTEFEKTQNWRLETKVLLSPLGGPSDCLVLRFPLTVVQFLDFLSIEHFLAPRL